MENDDSSVSSADRLQELEDQLKADPYSFSTLEALISLHRDAGNLQEVTQYREQLHSLYCLPEWMWVDWLQDEIMIASENATEPVVQRIRALFDRALADYSYRKVHKLRIQFEMSFDDVEAVRMACEKAVVLWGLDLHKSAKLWRIYLDFEMSQFEVAAESDQSLIASKIRSIFRRRCFFPTSEINEAWQEYQIWETDQEELSKVQVRYEQALSKVEAYTAIDTAFEQARTKMHEQGEITDMLEFFRHKLPQFAGDNFNYIQLFFERLLPEFTLNVDLWRLYVGFAKELCKKQALKQQIMARALKNCYQHADLWIDFMLEVEKQDGEQVKPNGMQAIEQLIASGQATADFVGRVLIHCHEAMARMLGFSDSAAVRLNSNYEESVLFMAQLSLEGMQEQQVRLMERHAEVVAQVGDYAKLSELLTIYVKAKNNSVDSWRKSVELCKVLANKKEEARKHVRSQYKRALKALEVQADRQQIAQDWISWEKLFGTASTLEECLMQTLNDITTPPAQTETKAIPLRDKSDRKRKPATKVEQLEKEVQSDNEKSHLSTGSVKKKHTLFLRNLSDTTEEADLELLFKDIVPDCQINSIRLIRDETGQKRGIAFIDVASQTMAERALKINNHHVKGSMVQIFISKPPALQNADDRTAFVNNLPRECTEEDIRQLIGSETIDEVRLIRDPAGKLKGFCYVQFYEPEQCKTAIEKYHKAELKGKTINVTQTMSKDSLNESNSHKTVLITNLSFRVSEGLLRDFLVNSYCDGDQSKVEKVTLVKDERGSSKGFAFVQFVDVETARRVLDAKEFSLQGRLALIKQSKREIVEKKVERRKRDVKRAEKEESKTESIETNQDFKNFLFGKK